MTRPLLPTPPAWVREGRFELGTFASPLAEINPLDAKFGPTWRRGLRRWRLKEWQHFALVNDSWYLSLALFDAKLLALAQVCLFDRRRGRTFFYERRLPSWRVQLPATLFDSRVSVESGGLHLCFENRLEPAIRGEHRIDFSLDGGRSGAEKLPPASGRFTLFEPLAPAALAVTPIVASLPLPGGGALYSHKCVLPCEGLLEVAGERIEFSRTASYGLVDVHKGFYPWEMTWHWATAGQAGPAGVRGFNLTNNQVVDQESYNENCLWAAGDLHLLPPVRFEIDGGEAAIGRPWRIRDARGQVDLTFVPEAIRAVDINLGVLRSRYRGPFGAFSGIIRAGEGDLAVEGWFGMCEDFYLRA